MKLIICFQDLGLADKMDTCEIEVKKEPEDAKPEIEDFDSMDGFSDLAFQQVTSRLVLVNYVKTQNLDLTQSSYGSTLTILLSTIPYTRAGKLEKAVFIQNRWGIFPCNNMTINLIYTSETIFQIMYQFAFHNYVVCFRNLVIKTKRQ